jgi:NhaP-type Na+/H+ or K+/H+ antiporter
MWDRFVSWLTGLGQQYGVDPLIYAILYVGSAPFFFGSLAWLIRRLRRHEAWGAPAASTAFFFILPTLYVVLAGRNLPWGAWAVLAVLTVIGAATVIGRIRRELRSSD